MSEFQKRVNAELSHIKLCEDDAEVIYRIAQELAKPPLYLAYVQTK